MFTNIQEIMRLMKESNYFDAWSQVLLGSDAEKNWTLLLEDYANETAYVALAEQLHLYDVPYVIVSEYIDEFFRYCKDDGQRHAIKNKIAEAYLNKKLIHDKELLTMELSKNLSVLLESKQELINAHLHWMKKFIGTVIGVPEYFELDPRKCFVGRWILEEKENISKALVKQHSNIHSMAQSALRMYQQKDYAYFLLLYMDILASSYQIRDSIMNIYFNRRFTSIFKDPLSEQFNYFQLKNDIQKSGSESSILLFNIKEFKKMNLLYGHDVCDKIIRNVADIVSEIEGVMSTYRIYGDEFAIVFPTEYTEKVLAGFKEKLYKYLFDFGKEQMTLSFYGSVATISQHILEHCEYGLMISKHQNGEIIDVSRVDKDVLKKYASEINLSQKLKLAFLDNRIVSYYQPIQNLHTGEITKYEVLMRVKDVDESLLAPAEFLGVLQEMYLYPEVTKLMIKNSFEFFQDKTATFSVNLSYQDLNNEETKAFIREIVKENPEVASRCIFELLEYDSMSNIEEMKLFFEDLHSFGVGLALDDFGVGYSNYETIFQFQIDFIKIDGSLVESIIESEKSKVLVESIMTVAEQIGAEVVVEYVSSEKIYSVVKAMGIDYAQGYYVGKPASTLVFER